MSLRVVELSPEREPLWDEFVNRCPGALPQHLLGWREVMRRTYGYRTNYLMVEGPDGIAGLMPLIEVPSLLEGHHLTTMPGGICASSEEAGQALIRRAGEIVEETKAQYLILRDTRRIWTGDLQAVGDNCSVLVDVSNGSQAVWRGLRSSVRTNIRQAERAGVELREGLDQLDDFYNMFSQFCRDRGTPIFSRQWLREVVGVFGPQTYLLGAWHGSEMVGGYFGFKQGSLLTGMWGAALPRFHHLRPNDAIYWRVIQYADEQGLSHVDLGRSRLESGQHRFKLKWLGYTVPVYHQFHVRAGAKLPFPTEPGGQPVARRLMQVWSRLPLGLAQRVGPLVRKQVPFG